MPSVYNTQARNKVQELHGKPVLVREPQPIAKGLEVPQYYSYLNCARPPVKYVPMTSTALEMLYIKKGENASVGEIVRLFLSKEFPKTFDFLMQVCGVEYKLEKRFYGSLNNLEAQKHFVEKTGPGTYGILKEVRKNQIVPDCLNIQTSNLDSPLTVKQL